MSPVAQNDPTLNAFQYAIARHFSQVRAAGRDEATAILKPMVEGFRNPPATRQTPVFQRKPKPPERSHPWLGRWRNRYEQIDASIESRTPNQDLEQRIFENGRAYEQLLISQAERGNGVRP